VRRHTITLAVAASLAVYFFFFMLSQLETPRHYDGNTTNFYEFAHMGRARLVDTNFDAAFPVFKTRVLSQVIAGKATDWAVDHPFTKVWNGYRYTALQVVFAAYQSGWLLLTFLTIWRFRRDAVFVVLCVYAGVLYESAVVIGSWFMPYDMPILCLFTWSWLAWEAQRRLEFAVVAVAACAFKETGLVLWLLPFLAGRWRLAGVVAVAGYAARAVPMHVWRVDTIAFPLNDATSYPDLFHRTVKMFWDNTVSLSTLHLNHFVFTGCGLVALLFFLRAKWQTKVFAGAYMLGEWCFGTAIEVRDFYEIMPLAACVASENLSLAPSRPPAAKPSRRSPLKLLSVVVPAKDEPDHIVPFVKNLHDALSRAAVPYEVVVVVDDPADPTVAAAEARLREYNLRVVVNTAGPGIGHAVRTGLLWAKGDAVVFAMADESEDPKDVVRYWNELGQSYDCVFGTRFSRGGHVEGYPLAKLAANRLGNLLVRWLFVTDSDDLTNGFKAYRTDALRRCVASRSNHFDYGMEMAVNAVVAGCSVKTIGVVGRSRKRGESKFRLVRMCYHYAATAVRLWLRKEKIL